MHKIILTSLLLYILIGTYLNDFKRTANKQIQMTGSTIVNGVTPDQCAKMCEETTAYVCKSFDFCPNTTTCRMTSKSLKNVGQVTLLSSAYCSVYTRKRGLDMRAEIKHSFCVLS